MSSLVKLCLLPQTDPARFIALLQTVEGRQRVAKIWALCGITITAVLFIGSYIFLDDVWLLPILAIGAYSIVLFFTGSAIPITWNMLFWTLYTISPLMLMVYLLTVFGIYLPYIGNFFYLIFGYSIGVLIAVAGAVWVYKEENQRLRYDERREKGGIESQIPPLQKWRKTIVIRWVFAGLASCLVLLLPFIVSPNERATAWWIVLIVIAFAAGVLRVDATLALLTGYPATTRNPQARYQSTFAGRFSLWLPSTIQQSVSPPPADAAQSRLALLWDGSAPNTLIAYTRQLEPASRDKFLFALSLYAGGGETLRLIATSSAISSDMRATAQSLHLLAEESALPFQFQQWRTVLADAIPALHKSNLPLAELLTEVRNSMNATRLSPQNNRTTKNFSQFLSDLVPHYGNPVTVNCPPQEMSWLVVLYHQLVQHQHALLSTRNN